MNKNGLMEFIGVYRERRCLWDSSDPSYTNKIARNAAQMALLKIFKKYDSTANLDSVRKKIDSLRTGYLREHKKVLASTALGSSDVYVPTLWYYHQLNFLKEEQKVPRVKADSIDPPRQSFPDKERREEDCRLPREDAAGFQSPPHKPLKLQRMISDQRQLIAAVEKLANIPETGLSDNWEAFGLSVGGDLRNLESIQQTIAQKLISDVIFLAKMGRLSEDSAVADTADPW